MGGTFTSLIRGGLRVAPLFFLGGLAAAGVTGATAQDTGTVTLRVVDGVGREGAGRFTLLRADGERVATTDAGSGVVAAPAGTYSLVPDYDRLTPSGSLSPEASIANSGPTGRTRSGSGSTRAWILRRWSMSSSSSDPPRTGSERSPG
jgi:hypothetical protein